MKKKSPYQIFILLMLLMSIFPSYTAVSAATNVQRNISQQSTSSERILQVNYVDQVWVQKQLVKQDFKKWYSVMYYLCGTSSLTMATDYLGVTDTSVETMAKASTIITLPNHATSVGKINSYLKDTQLVFNQKSKITLC